MSGYPKGFLAVLLGVLAALFVSGCLLVANMIHMRLGLAMPWRLSGDARLAATAIHVAVSFLVIAALGALWAVHMRGHWRLGRNRRSGALLMGAWLVLIASGVGVLYLGNETASLAVSLAHVLVGLLLPLGLLAHVVIGRRGARAARRDQPASFARRDAVTAGE